MGNVNPATLRDVFIILTTIVLMICALIRTYNGSKSKPPTGESLATLGTKMDAIEKDLEETKQRHAAFEKKMSDQNNDIWQAVDRMSRAVAANGATLELFIDEIRNWRNNHA